MKINFENENAGTTIRNICVGETFFTQRRSIKERGLYMKIDGNSGLVRNKCGRSYSYAVNLESGQLREFDSDCFVEKVFAEINFPKK